MKTPSFSVIIPAHNEELFIEPCLEAIEKAEKPPGSEYEIIVVLNRCTDRTEEIARAHKARIVRENAKVLSVIRNAGANQAKHAVIMTIDADSIMSGNMFMEVYRHLESGKYIGGGVSIDLERWSFPLWLTNKLLNLVILVTGISGGLYWCYKSDFDAIGGFSEDVRVGEDVDFAHRLKRYGKKQKKRFATIRKAKIVTSCRKFDVLGDTVLLRYFFNPLNLLRLITGKTGKLGCNGFAEDYFYDFDNRAAKEAKHKSAR